MYASFVLFYADFAAVKYAGSGLKLLRKRIIILLFTCPYFFVCVGVSVNFFLPMVNLSHNCICTLTIVRMHVKTRLRMKLL